MLAQNGWRYRLPTRSIAKIHIHKPRNHAKKLACNVKLKHSFPWHRKSFLNTKAFSIRTNKCRQRHVTLSHVTLSHVTKGHVPDCPLIGRSAPSLPGLGYCESAGRGGGRPGAGQTLSYSARPRAGSGHRNWPAAEPGVKGSPQVRSP